MIVFGSYRRLVPIPLVSIVGIEPLAAVARGDVVFLCICGRIRLDHRADYVTHRREPLRNETPRLGLRVPLLDPDLAAAFMIGTGDLDVADEIDETL